VTSETLAAISRYMKGLMGTTTTEDFIRKSTGALPTRTIQAVTLKLPRYSSLSGLSRAALNPCRNMFALPDLFPFWSNFAHGKKTVTSLVGGFRRLCAAARNRCACNEPLLRLWRRYQMFSGFQLVFS